MRHDLERFVACVVTIGVVFGVFFGGLSPQTKISLAGLISQIALIPCLLVPVLKITFQLWRRRQLMLWQMFLVTAVYAVGSLMISIRLSLFGTLWTVSMSSAADAAVVYQEDWLKVVLLINVSVLMLAGIVILVLSPTQPTDEERSDDGEHD